MAKFKQKLGKPMAKKKFDDPRQLSLFDVIKQEAERQDCTPKQGCLDVDNQFRGAVTEALKKCKLSRAEVAAKMSDLTGSEITVTMINGWTAESKERHRFPAIFLPALYQVTKSVWLYRLLMKPVGLFVMESPQALLSEEAEIAEQIKELQKEQKKRRALREALTK